MLVIVGEDAQERLASLIAACQVMVLDISQNQLVSAIAAVTATGTGRLMSATCRVLVLLAASNWQLFSSVVCWL